MPLAVTLCFYERSKESMRECIYCGRQLEKGEKCTCAMSVAKRMEREKQQSEQAASETPPKSKREQKREERQQARTEKQRQKTEQRESNKKRFEEFKDGLNKNAFSNVWRLFKDFIRSPLDTVMNPGIMSKTEVLIFVIIEGIVSGLCVYSVITGASRGPLRLLGNLFGFRGVQGYNVVLGWLSSAFSGAVSGLIIFFLFTGIFYFINKSVFKQFTAYWDFARRFAFVAIPTTLIGAVGVLLGFFSQTTFAVMLLCGISGTIVLVYEILRSMWHSKSATKTIYTMMIGFFIFLLITLYIARLTVL